MKTLFNTVAVGALFTGIASLASPTQAEPILKLNFDTGNHGNLFPAGSDAMRIHFDNTSGTTKHITVAAGMFSGVAVEDGSTVDIKTLFESAENVLAYCIDILQFLDASAVYEIEDVPDEIYIDDHSKVQRNFGRMLSFLGAVNAVLQGSEYEFTPDTRNWLRPTEGWMSGAIQLGIWESLYEDTGTDLSVKRTDDSDGQWFWADVGDTNTNQNVDPLGIDFLDDVFGLVNTGGDFAPISETEVLWARNSTGQDLLIDPVDVPVPATVFLLFGGLGALAWRGRRQRD